MCQYGNQVTTSPTETVVLWFSPSANQPGYCSLSKKRPEGRCAYDPRLCCYPNSDMAVYIGGRKCEWVRRLWRF
jgi:hypothetical protein